MLKREELSNPNSCMSRAKDDEMTFVLLGRDAAAPATIRAWVAERLQLGKNTAGDEQIREALACANQIEAAHLESGALKAPERDPNRCAVCGWPLADSFERGCVRGNCSLRPLPLNYYDPERAKRESVIYR